MSETICCGAVPPYSVTYIDPSIVGGGGDRWFVMGTVDGDPRDSSGPVAICEYEPSAHVIAALLNASGGCAPMPTDSKPWSTGLHLVCARKDGSA